MPVEERRRIALHRKAADAWGEEAADTLFEMVTPAGRDLATTDDIRAFGVDVDSRFAQVDARFAQVDARFDAVDARFGALEAHIDLRLDGLKHELLGAFKDGIADAVTTQTRTLVLSQLVALVAISGLAFGLG